MATQPGRKKWTPKFGMAKPPTQTMKANNTPRLGQSTKTPYRRWLDKGDQYAMATGQYGAGRTRRTPYK